jgi:hypothetical protein
MTKVYVLCSGGEDWKGNDWFNLILSFRRILYVVCFLLGISPASEFSPAYEDGTDRGFRNVGF